ncbi:Hypothetical protein D9617_20g028280 [Elsinoe fawcettii]|nr:Hypothetical protein D9617_20g028280 [Elsinoe fawcettii]
MRSVFVCTLFAAAVVSALPQLPVPPAQDGDALLPTKDELNPTSAASGALALSESGAGNLTGNGTLAAVGDVTASAPGATAIKNSTTSASTYGEACNKAPSGYDTCKSGLATWAQNMVPAIEIFNLEIRQTDEAGQHGALAVDVSDDGYAGSCNMNLATDRRDDQIEVTCAKAGEEWPPTIIYHPKGCPGCSGKPAIEYSRFFHENCLPARYFGIFEIDEPSTDVEGLMQFYVEKATIWYTGGERPKYTKPEAQEADESNRAACQHLGNFEPGSPEDLALNTVNGRPDWILVKDPRDFKPQDPADVEAASMGGAGSNLTTTASATPTAQQPQTPPA